MISHTTSFEGRTSLVKLGNPAYISDIMSSIHSCNQNNDTNLLSLSSRPTGLSMIAAGVVGGLLAALIAGLSVFVLLRRRHIKRKRTMRRLLREKEVQ